MSRVAIVGGGAIGLCVGISLRGRGLDVTIIDDASGPPGASAWNCGWLAPSHVHPLPGPAAFRRSLRWLLSRGPAPLSIRPEPRLARWLLGFAWSSRATPHRRGFEALAAVMPEALPAWKRLEQDGLAIPWRTEGAFVPFLDRTRLDSEVRHLDELVDLGLAHPVVHDAAAAHERMPSFSNDVVGAIELAGEPGIDPPALVDSLRARFDALGGVRRADRVIDLHRPPGRPPAIVTRSTTESFDRVVLAAGAWSGTLARRLGMRLPVTSGRGYAIDLPSAPGHPERVVQLLEASMAIAPLGDQLRLCGTMELASPTAALDQERVRLMLRSPGRYFAGWSADASPIHVMAAPRPMTPDGLPVIGMAPSAPDIVLATGHGMLGMTLAAVTGELVATLIADDRDEIPAAFRPSRFHW